MGEALVAKCLLNKPSIGRNRLYTHTAKLLSYAYACMHDTRDNITWFANNENVS